MKDVEIIEWLLEGDVAIQYQVHRDLLGLERRDLQQRIETEGWGKQYLDLRGQHGHWGLSYYQPKWTSSHYTLFDLKNLGIDPAQAEIRETLELIIKRERAPDGGIHPIGTTTRSDVCINGMMLNVMSYFGIEEQRLHEVIDFILSQNLPDGGYNCRLNRSGAKHSSLHTTISVVEGFLEYRENGYTYRLDEVMEAEKMAQEFMLMHHLFKSDRTGQIIHPKFLRLPYPFRWYYDILRALDYFAQSGREYDPRMQDAIDVLLSKQMPDGRWKVQAAHPGKVHFTMEAAGEASRWNTLRARRALKVFQGVRLEA